MAAKRGNQSEETLREAVRLVQDEGYSYGDVFKLTGVPKTTLFKYAKSTVVIKKKQGPVTILTKDEELCLVEWATKLVRVKKDIKRKEAIEKRIKRRQNMNKNKKQNK